MSIYSQFGRRAVTQTPQSKPIVGRESEMIPNDAGGYGFTTDMWKKLNRFLIIGTEEGGYYVNAKDSTMRNYKNVLAAIESDGFKVVDEVVRVSQSGVAIKNDPALFVLALAASAKDEKVRAYALSKLPLVARTGTHLFHFVEFVTKHRGWGRALKNAVARWFTEKSLDQLAIQVLKYKSRDGWSMRDLLRLTHPKSDKPGVNNLFKWVVKPESIGAGMLPEIIEASLLLHDGRRIDNPAKLISRYNLPWEALPTEMLRDPKVWSALVTQVGLEGVMRNLGRMSNVGAFEEGMTLPIVVDRLTDPISVQRARLHPIKVLLALKTYAQGRGMLGSMTWLPNQKIVKALDTAFELSFKNLQPIPGRALIALDGSGSMWGRDVVPGLSSAAATAAVAKVLAEQFSHAEVIRYTTRIKGSFAVEGRRLDDILADYARMQQGEGTDVGSPMNWAYESNRRYDFILNMTDSQSWYGSVHPAEAVRQYRKISPRVRVAYLVTEANTVSCADPQDLRQLDIAGFDAGVCELLAKFAKGEF